MCHGKLPSRIYRTSGRRDLPPLQEIMTNQPTDLPMTGQTVSQGRFPLITLQLKQQNNFRQKLLKQDQNINNSLQHAISNRKNKPIGGHWLEASNDRFDEKFINDLKVNALLLGKENYMIKLTLKTCNVFSSFNTFFSFTTLCFYFKAVFRVGKIFLMYPLFFTLYDQQGSRWTIQVDLMFLL